MVENARFKMYTMLSEEKVDAVSMRSAVGYVLMSLSAS